MTAQQLLNREKITRILEKLYDLNTRGHYTAWLDFVGHTNSIEIRVIKGKWKENAKQTYVCDYLVNLDRMKDSFTCIPFDVEQFLTMIDGLIKYKPLKKSKR